MYNPKSMTATEFIDNDEILDTLRYAEEHKNDLALVNSIIERAGDCKGLTHREAAVLLLCEDQDMIQKMFDQATKIKQAFYGNRIVMFAPLYLSNYCVNGCVYCPYHKTGGNRKGSHRFAGYGAQAACLGNWRRSGKQSD